MTSAPYALGVFRRPAVAPGQGEDGDGEEFTGRVVGDRVRDVGGLGTMNELLARWDDAQCRLGELAKSESSGDRTDLARLTGPYLVPAKFVKDPADLRITLRHNGIVRQDETTADMLFDLPAVLAYITGITELRPGDLVLTGSPAGNGMHWGVFLAEGDLIEGEITGLGTQRNRCVIKHAIPQEASRWPSP